MTSPSGGSDQRQLLEMALRAALDSLNYGDVPNIPHMVAAAFLKGARCASDILRLRLDGEMGDFAVTVRQAVTDLGEGGAA